MRLVVLVVVVVAFAFAFYNDDDDDYDEHYPEHDDNTVNDTLLESLSTLLFAGDV